MRKNIFFVAVFVIVIQIYAGYTANIATPTVGVYNYSYNNYLIKWRMSVTAADKTIRLYYDNDTNPIEKILINELTAAAEAETGDYLWNTDEMPSGSYIIHFYQTVNGADTLYTKSLLPVVIKNYSDTISIPSDTQYLNIISNSVILDAADLNGDGYEDLIFTGTYEYSDTLNILAEISTPEYWEYILQDGYSNYSNGAVIEITGSVVSGGLKAVDLNANGKTDVAIAVTKKFGNFPLIQTKGYLTVYHQTGDLTFTKTEYELSPIAAGFPAINVATDLTVVDFNGDTLPDLAILQYNFMDTTQDGRVHIFLQNHDGTFSENQVGGYITSPSPYRISTGDYNNDNKNDIVVICKYSNILNFFYQGNSGNVSDTYFFSVGARPVTLKNININNDGKTDIALTLKDDNKISVYTQGINGAFDFLYDLSTPANPQGLEVYDFNIDGLDDIVVSCEVGGADSNAVVFFVRDGDTFVQNTYIAMSEIPLDLKIINENINGRPSLAAMTYNQKIFLNRTIPLNYPPVLIDINASLQVDSSYMISVFAYDHNNDNLTITIGADNNNIGFDGAIISTVFSTAPYDTVTHLISPDSFLFDTNYLFMIVSDGVDSNYYYFHTPLIKYEQAELIDSGLFTLIVDWNAFDTGVYFDSIHLLINDTSGMNIQIEINGVTLTDSYLTVADTDFFQYLSWDSGYYDIVITAQNSSGTTQIENLRILRNVQTEIFDSAVTDTFFILADSSSVTIILNEITDTKNIQIIINDTQNFGGSANLIIGTAFDDTKLITFTRTDNFVDTMPILSDYEYCSSSILQVNYGLISDTTILAADTGTHKFYLDLFFDEPSNDLLNYKIFVYYPDADSGYIVNIEILNGHITGVLPVAYNFYIALIKPKRTALQALGDDIAVYPNPWIPNDNNISTGNYSTGVYIRNLRINDSLKIYSFSGELIFTHNFACADIDYYNWNCRDNKNNYIASGVYFIAVRRANSGRNIIKKFMVVK